jgi:hypothetical protein
MFKSKGVIPIEKFSMNVISVVRFDTKLHDNAFPTKVLARGGDPVIVLSTDTPDNLPFLAVDTRFLRPVNKNTGKFVECN